MIGNIELRRRPTTTEKGARAQRALVLGTDSTDVVPVAEDNLRRSTFMHLLTTLGQGGYYTEGANDPQRTSFEVVLQGEREHLGGKLGKRKQFALKVHVFRGDEPRIQASVLELGTPTPRSFLIDDTPDQIQQLAAVPGTSVQGTSAIQNFNGEVSPSARRKFLDELLHAQVDPVATERDRKRYAQEHPQEVVGAAQEKMKGFLPIESPTQ